MPEDGYGTRIKWGIQKKIDKLMRRFGMEAGYEKPTYYTEYETPDEEAYLAQKEHFQRMGDALVDMQVRLQGKGKEKRK